MELERRHELAEFLRSRRARISPEQVGLARGLRRRTPGLRREEVAMIAGVSPEWYTWLEQGRDINVSMQLLESLARVLQMDPDEREHLFLLAQRQPPPVETYVPPRISLALRQFLDALGTTPASLSDARLTIVAWNAAHCAVFGDYDALPERERNLLWRIFTAPAKHLGSPEWERLALPILARFRAGYARFINDPWWGEQIAELSRISPEFRTLWARHDVLNLAEGFKVVHNPSVGDLAFDVLWLQTSDAGDLRLLIHTPHAGTDTAEKIERLMAHPPTSAPRQASPDLAPQPRVGEDAHRTM